MKMISKQWLFKHYIELNWNAQMCADKRKVPLTQIRDLIKKYEIQKWKWKAHKVWNKPKLGKKFYKHAQKIMPHRKPIIAFRKVSTTGIETNHGTYMSINDCAKSLGLRREYIRDILNPNKKRWSTKGWYFKHKELNKIDDKEFIIHRTNKKIEKIFKGLA